ncbi:MAG: type I-E CRISPR-associated endoribonuclease Cas2, partial [Saccharomonospora viridis]
VRDRLWELLATRIADGQAILVEPADNEQGWAVRTAGTDRWRPTDFDGLILSARPRRH